jgi:hypothetical protein
MLSLVADILICFFAVIGATLSVMILFDIYTAKKTGLSVDIRINPESTPENCEYSVRILQSLINHSALGKLAKNITIPKSAFPEEKLPEKLFSQYKNLKKEE